MTRIFLTLCFTLFITGCGKKGSSQTSESATATQKSLFSKWTHRPSGFELDFTGGEFQKNLLFYVYLPTTQKWIDVLNFVGRDTTGLKAGDMHFCLLEIYFWGTESSGNIAMNHVDIDTPEHNACLEWDNNCQSGPCNFAEDHLYMKSNNTLVMDYFGAADDGFYGVDVME